jgi:phage-related protein
MKKKVHFKHVLAFLGVAAFFWIGPSANAQTQDNNPPPRNSDTRFNDTTRAELASFDRFLDGHREIAEQLHKDPSLVKNSQFVQNHPALQTYLQQHPGVREELTENPSAFLRQENRYDRNEDVRDRDLNRSGNDRDLDARRDTDNRSASGNTTNTARTGSTAGGSTDGRPVSGNAGVSRSTTNATSPSTAANTNSRTTTASSSTTSPSQAADQQATDNQQNVRDDERQGGQGDRERGELGRFDQFLDSHRGIAEQLRRNPSLADNQQYLQDHPALQNYLQDHPAIREQLTQHPDAFMQREDRYDYREDARDRKTNQGELARFDQFLDGHREIAEQLRKNPSLANNQQFGQNHPALQSFLQQNPEIRQQLAQNPDTFMQREDRYDTREEARNYDRRDFDERQDNRERGVNREERAGFDHFLDSHREEAEQLRRNPSLANNKQFVESHPALQAYLQDHQGVREQLAQNPNGFMREEDRYDRREDMDRSHMQQAANFRDFLGGHSRISDDLSRNPMKANDPDYKRSHPELQAYLSAHPDVQSALNQNPHSFMKTVQQPASPATTTSVTIGATTTGATGTTKTATPPAPKPPMQ